jgi:exopolysaccharide biosynthesis polyprenyl glycosylphosphotransferase
MTVAQRAAGEAVSSSTPRANLANLSAQRRFQLAGLVITDLVTSGVAFFLAYHARYTLAIGGDVPGESYVPYGDYFLIHVLFVAFCLIGNQIRGTYVLPRGASVANEAMSVFGVMGVVTVVVVFTVTVARWPAESRLMYSYAFILASLMGIIGRLLVRGMLAHLYRAGYGTERVIVVGSHRLARMVMQLLAQQSHLGYRVLGFVDNETQADFGRFPALGAVEQLPSLINRLEVNRVIVALPANHHSEALWVLDHCRKDGVALSMVPDLFELRLSHLDLDTVGGIPVFRMRDSAIVGWNFVIKRVMDWALSTILLVGAIPLFLLIATAIKLDSAGPVFFRQKRLGKGGAEFICYKFRSMREGAEEEVVNLLDRNEADGAIFKIREDPRVTRVGKLLRRTSLDELPQLWNVLRGEMSLVGPRPPIPAEVEHYEEWHKRRLEVTPGITGLWQVSGRSELSFDEMVTLDIYYIENWSLSLDLEILARTVPAVTVASGAF